MLKLRAKNWALSWFILGALFSGCLLHAQNTAQIIDWKFLSQVEFKDQYFEDYEAWYLVPVFSEAVQKLDGQKVIIKGYVIPMDVEGGQYALSAYPFSACFFCGGAGPETVMSLHFDKKPKRYETDDVVRFTGELHLNDSDFDDFNYVLKHAQPLKK